MDDRTNGMVLWSWAGAAAGAAASALKSNKRTDRWAHSVGSKICRDAWVGSGEKGARAGGDVPMMAAPLYDMMDMVLGS